MLLVPVKPHVQCHAKQLLECCWCPLLCGLVHFHPLAVLMLGVGPAQWYMPCKWGKLSNHVVTLYGFVNESLTNPGICVTVTAAAIFLGKHWVHACRINMQFFDANFFLDISSALPFHPCTANHSNELFNSLAHLRLWRQIVNFLIAKPTKGWTNKSFFGCFATDVSHWKLWLQIQSWWQEIWMIELCHSAEKKNSWDPSVLGSTLAWSSPNSLSRTLHQIDICGAKKRTTRTLTKVFQIWDLSLCTSLTTFAHWPHRWHTSLIATPSHSGHLHLDSHHLSSQEGAQLWTSELSAVTIWPWKCAQKPQLVKPWDHLWLTLIHWWQCPSIGSMSEQLKV